jgi:uncharacterized protein (TIGR03435 family)
VFHLPYIPKTPYRGKYDQAGAITRSAPPWWHNCGMVRPSLLIVLAALSWSASHSIAQTSQRVQFEVATIRLNNACVNGAGLEHLSLGRFGVECVSLRDYIRGAFGSYGFGRNPHVRPPKVMGGPDWVDTDRYDIVAKTPAEAGLDEMYGPMMRALLEDRFGLKIHSEIRELPVYALTAARGGAKLTPSKPGSCVAIDVKSVLQAPPGPNYCGRFDMTRGTVRIADAKGITVAGFAARVFRDTLDRPVIDKTGIAGLFDIHLEFSGVDDDSAAPSIFTAVQEQLGLKLSPDTGPVDVLVIDHVQKPSPN